MLCYPVRQGYTVGARTGGYDLPGGSSHGLGPAVADARELVVVVPAPAFSQGLGGRAVQVQQACVSYILCVAWPRA